jgi:hypothetical protein
MSTPTRLRITFALLMSGLMSLLMTGWIGWAHAFVLAWPAAFSIVLATGPTVQRFSQRLVTG